MFFTRILRSQQQSLAHLVDHYAQYRPTGLTMKKIVDFGKKNITIFVRFSSNFSHRFSTGRRCKTIVFVSTQRITRSISIDDERNESFADSSSANAERSDGEQLVRNESNWTSFVQKSSTHERCRSKVRSIDKKKAKKTIIFVCFSIRFTKVLQNIRKRHTKVVETLAQVKRWRRYSNENQSLISKGYMEFSDLGQAKDYEESQIQYFLDRFYLSRISIRLLIYQHSSFVRSLNRIFLWSNEFFFSNVFRWRSSNSSVSFGFCRSTLFCRRYYQRSDEMKTNIVKVFHFSFFTLDAFENAQFLCEGFYMTSPSLNIRMINGEIRSTQR